MTEHSKVIEEYLLTLYKLNRAGEPAKSGYTCKTFGHKSSNRSCNNLKNAAGWIGQCKKNKRTCIDKRRPKY